MQLLWAEAARAEAPADKEEFQRRIREKAKMSLSKGYSDGRLGAAVQFSASRLDPRLYRPRSEAPGIRQLRLKARSGLLAGYRSGHLLASVRMLAQASHAFQDCQGLESWFKTS